MKIEELVKKLKKKLRNRETTDVDPSELDETITSWDKRKATIESKELYNKIADIINACHDQVSYEKRKHKSPIGEETAVLYLGDIHYGAIEEENGEIIYNSEIAKDRIHKLYDSTSKLIDFIEENRDLGELDIAFLGDIIENDIIYENQKYDIDKTPLDQVREAVRAFTPFIKRFAEDYDYVRIFGVRGNHGRLSKHTHDENNWDNIFYHMLKLSLENVNNAQVRMGENGWAEFDVYDKTIGINHGKELHYQAATSAGEKTFLRQFHDRDLDEIHVGHYHKRASEEILGNMVYWNGAIKPSGDFEQKLGVGAIPSQTLMTYNKSRGTTGIHYVDIRSEDKLEEKL